MKNSSYYIAPVGDRTHDLLHTVASNMVKVSYALTHSATAAVNEMMGIKRIETIRNEEIRARAGVANISEKIRDAKLRWLGRVERKTEEDIVMRTWKMVDTER